MSRLIKEKIWFSNKKCSQFYLDPSSELFQILNIETDSVKTYTISN